MNLKDFSAYLEARNLSQNTINAYLSDLRYFQAFLKSKGLRCTSATPKLVQDFVNRGSLADERDLTRPAPATVVRRIASISTYYKWLRIQSNGKLHNPAEVVPRPRCQRGVPQGIENTQVDCLLQQITDKRDKALVALFVSSGLRLSEVFQLNRDAINVEQKKLPDGLVQILGVGAVIGKGRKKRTFLLDRSTIGLVVTYLRSRRDQCPALFISNRNQRLSRREMQHIFRKWCRRLGLPDFHVHQLRHSAAERWANAGMPSIVLKDLMGHESFSTTQGYFRIKRQRLATEYYAAMELISPSTPAESSVS